MPKYYTLTMMAGGTDDNGLSFAPMLVPTLEEFNDLDEAIEDTDDDDNYVPTVRRRNADGAVVTYAAQTAPEDVLFVCTVAVDRVTTLQMFIETLVAMGVLRFPDEQMETNLKFQSIVDRIDKE